MKEFAAEIQQTIKNFKLPLPNKLDQEFFKKYHGLRLFALFSEVPELRDRVLDEKTMYEKILHL